VTEPWQRDPTGLFYVPPGNEYAKSCLLGCGLLIAGLTAIVVVAATLGPTWAVIAGVVMLAAFWMWDR
jgi:hypothetical protein